MLLKPPFEIGSRWRAYFDLPEGEFTEDGLGSSPTDADDAKGTQKAFGALLAFLSACGEGVNYELRTERESENASLFCNPVAEWAAANLGEIDCVRFGLEESGEAYLSEGGDDA